jgi:hypothetical protein
MPHSLTNLKHRVQAYYKRCEECFEINVFHSEYQHLLSCIQQEALFSSQGLLSCEYRQIFWPILIGFVYFESPALKIENSHEKMKKKSIPKSLVRQIETDVSRTIGLITQPIQKSQKLLRYFLIKLFTNEYPKQHIDYTQGIHECLVMMFRIFLTKPKLKKIPLSLIEKTSRKLPVDEFFQIVTDVCEDSKKNLLCLYYLCERFVLGYFYDLLTVPLDWTMVTYLKMIGVFLSSTTPTLFSLLTLSSRWKSLKDYDINNYNETNLSFLSGFEFQNCLPWILTFFTHDLLRYHTKDSMMRFNLCCRIWDSLLAGPPHFCIYFCAIVLQQTYIVDSLFRIAKKYHIYRQASPYEENINSHTLKYYPNIPGLYFSKDFRSEDIDLLDFELAEFLQHLLCDTPINILVPLLQKALYETACFLKQEHECIGTFKRSHLFQLLHISKVSYKLPCFSYLYLNDWPWRFLPSPSFLSEQITSHHFLESWLYCRRETCYNKKQIRQLTQDMSKTKHDENQIVFTGLRHLWITEKLFFFLIFLMVTFYYHFFIVSGS